MRQILEGIHFLHAHDVVHLDLKVRSDSDTVLQDITTGGKWIEGTGAQSLHIISYYL